jgi:aminopeptidase N
MEKNKLLLMKSLLTVVFILIIVLIANLAFGAKDIYDSGGPLMPEQAAYDVTYYDLSLFVNPSDSSIQGSLKVNARIVQPLDMFVLDLDTLLKVHSIQEMTGNQSHELQFDHENGKIWINLNWTRQVREQITIQVNYEGRPRIAPRPPWSGGFTWDTTSTGSPWIATTCQGEGADIWWPNKDHVSDKPDSMRIHIRVKDPLIVASNGRLVSIESHDDNTTTYHWFVSTPISNYNVALNIAPYKVIRENYTSVRNDVIPVSFWILPEDYEKGVVFFPEILKHLEFYEKLLGPYPFRADKYGVAQTPHLGMEHQTIIAYGAKFNNSVMTRGKDWGFDALHHHELSHEWWGNAVTCSDWRDMWIHEGFGTYMQALYLEDTQGIEVYHEYLNSIRDFWNIYTVAPVNFTPASAIYKAPIYFKGAWILHSLRFLIGEDLLRLLLRRMIYPDPAMEEITDGRQVRFVSTQDFLYHAEDIYGQDLDWFFDVYLRQPDLPVLVSEIADNQLKIYWEVPEGLTFPMPVEIKFGDKIERVEVPSEGVILKFKNGIKPEIDPHNWLLYRQPLPKLASIDSSLLNNYTGLYEVKSGKRTGSIEITKNKQSLYIQTEKFPKIKIYPLSDIEFIIKEAENIRINFKFSEEGEIESLNHNLFRREVTYKKIN